MAPLRVIIVGGGIGGLAAAIALHRREIAVEVYERAPELREVGAGITLWANAMRALGELGVAEQLMAQGVPEGSGGIRDSGGRLLLNMSTRELEQRFRFPTLAVHRADLLTTLRAALPDDVVHLGKACAGFTPETGGVAVKFADGDSAHADILIGADGIHSVVRTQLWGASTPRYAGYTGWRAVTEFSHVGLPAGETWGCGARFGIVPMSQGRVYWFATKNAPEGEADPPQGRKRDLLERLGGWHAPIRELIAATPEAAILRNDIVDRPPLAQWGQGRVTLLGDAAHAMTPNLGQGACQAIEDAVALAEALATEPDPVAGLQSYERRRIGRATAIAARSWQIGRVAQLDNPLLCKARNAAVRATPRSATLRQFRWLLEGK